MLKTGRRLPATLALAIALASLAAVAASARAAPQADDGRRTVPAVRVAEESKPPVIDGLVNDEAWTRVDPISDFVQQEPNEGRQASERTEVRVLFDRTNVYIGIICFDTDPDDIVVTQSRRDADLNDTDSVQVVLDTFNDHQNGFVFGTNPLGIEYDGQVAGEGQTSGLTQARSGGAGSQRGQISGFNANWDGDWMVKSQITERGWETEMQIPLRTLRYAPGSGRVWGFNVMRNIRRKNEQVFLAPIPRGYTIHRVSQAATLTGLDLPPRRDIKAIPFILGSADKDYTAKTGQLDRDADVGIDLKWGIRPNLTADFTVNTDFAQVEADEEQVNLTRFPLFFPEKRPFFLENASVFQFGQPQQIDLFFTRRIGLSSSGFPIGIIGGARLSGKLAGYNVGVLNMQTEKTVNERTGQLVAPGNNFTVARVQREVGRSSYGGIFVNRQGTGGAAGPDNYNRAYGLDANVQLTQNSKLFSFLARTDSPGAQRSDYAGRIFYNFTNNLWNASVGYSHVGDRFNAEVGFVPRRGYRRPEGRVFFSPQPKRWPWIRRFSPHASYSAFYGLEGELQSSNGHYHFFEIQPARGGRFGFFVDRVQDRPVQPFVVFSGTDGRKVIIPPGLYTWNQFASEFISDPSAPIYGQIRHRIGSFYDGDFNGIESEIGLRLGSRFRTAVGYDRQNVDLAYGDFSTDLVSTKTSYSFTTLANLQALIQYNSQTSQLSSNIRLAFLDRSGTGFFIVFNDRHDTSTNTPLDLLGRSFIVKYTRLINF